MRRNLDPSIWGRGGWDFLHSCASAHDDESHDDYVQFLSLLPEVLPCARCRVHARRFLRENPPGRDVPAWLREFHADVSRRVRPQSCSLNTWTLLALLLLCGVVALALGLPKVAKR